MNKENLKKLKNIVLKKDLGVLLFQVSVVLNN